MKSKHVVVGICFSILSVICFSAQAALPLVGNKISTFIDKPDNSARASDIVTQALPDQNVTITATTQAWIGSGLRNGKFAGYIDHYSLNEPQSDYVYSQAYLSLPLHIASKYQKAEQLTRLDKIYRQRLGIESRFANTDQLRGERSVSWARATDFLGNIQQLAGQRVDYIIADKYMLEEFNKLLVSNGEEPLYLSNKPVFIVDVSVALLATTPNAKNLIETFNTNIAQMQEQDEIERIMNPPATSPSLLDESLYEDIIRRW